jgi:hypothetical protein
LAWAWRDLPQSFDSGLDDVLVSRRVCVGGGDTTSWRLMETEEVGNGAFKIVHELTSEDEIIDWLNDRVDGDRLARIEDLSVLDEFGFERRRLMDEVHIGAQQSVYSVLHASLGRREDD